jgi:hypothetical protein
LGLSWVRLDRPYDGKNKLVWYSQYGPQNQREPRFSLTCHKNNANLVAGASAFADQERNICPKQWPAMKAPNWASIRIG